jgi:hypothetical protein
MMILTLNKLKSSIKCWFNRAGVTLSSALLLAAASVLLPSGSDAQIPPQVTDHEAFSGYWYSGLAEISRYELMEYRYGEVREGDAVLIFVTEDFLTGRQVKLETPAGHRDYVSVLKLNSVRKYVTGIYDYSIMSSVFTPVPVHQWPRSLKATTSVQEWCGQTYSQINFMNNRYRVHSYSYFELDGDVMKYLPAHMLEDEIWTRLRLSPGLLPEGRFDIIPSGLDVRTAHSGWSSLKATGTHGEYNGEQFEGDGLRYYRLAYDDPGRTLTIVYEAAFPHRIAGWLETRNTPRGEETSVAIRTHEIRTAYWKENSVADEQLRGALGLQP